MAYSNINHTEEKKRKGSVHLSNLSAVIICLLVVLLLIAEGLIIGLVEIPKCNELVAVVSTTVKPSPSSPETTTSTNMPLSTTTAETVGPWTNYRMQLNLIPYEYEISLRPILQPVDDFNDSWPKQYTFKGSSTVRYTCEEPTNYIILHSKLLSYELSSWRLTEGSEGEIALKRMFYYDENEYVIIESEKACRLGANYELVLSDYTGQLGQNYSGLYMNDYTNKDGQYTLIVTSQMQPTGARKVFPCFDEPSFKAKFIIQLWHVTNSQHYSLSNMPVERTQVELIDGEQWTGTTFKQSVVMPTYLLAMVVVDFDYAESSTTGGVKITTYARPKAVNASEVNYSSFLTPLYVEFFERYTGISYSLGKLDQISVTNFRGAMENWGLMIYAEKYLLYNDDTTPDLKKIKLTNIVSHEVAHQWFGNLVSCDWWDQVWLNEGFATYFSYLAESDAQPTWKSKERFILEEMRLAFEVDELATSRQLVQPANSEAEVYKMFGDVTYGKGGSILRTVSGFMGEENLMNATKDFLLGRQYGVANQDQLFGYWEKYTTDLSLPTELSIIMETWTCQMGFPLVQVRDTGPLSNSFIVSQEYYLKDTNASPVQTPCSLKYGYRWYIPFTFKRGSNLAKDAELVWLVPDQRVTLSDSDFILGNADVQGYYRVNYDQDSWDRIANRLDSQFYLDIPEGNRAQLLDDAFSFASSDRLDPVVPIQMSKFLHRDKSYISWMTFAEDIKYYEYMLSRTEVFGTFQNYVLELVVPSLYDVYGWEDGLRTDDKLIERRTRALAIDTACHYGYSDCISKASSYFKSWMASPEDYTVIPMNSRSTIICAAIQTGGIDEWTFAWNMYKKTDSEDMSTSLRYGMACSKDPWILNRYLEYTLDSAMIKMQDAISTMEYVGIMDYGKDITWTFLVNHWDELLTIFGDASSFSGLVNSITWRFSTEFELKLLQDFKETTPNLGGLTITIDSAIEATKFNIAWRAKNEETLTTWFYDNVEEIA